MNDEIPRPEPQAPPADPGLPPGDAATAPPAAPSDEPARPGRRMFLVVILLLLATSLALQSPREVSRWYLAAARETHEQYKSLTVAARTLRAEAEESRAVGRKDAARKLELRAEEFERDAEAAFVDAVALVERAAEWAPGDPEPYRQLGRWYHLAEKYDESVEQADEIISLRPDDPKSYDLRVAARLEQKRYEDAVPDADRVVELVKKGGTPIPVYEALNEAAYFRALAQDDLDRALRDADEAVAMIRAARRVRRPTPASKAADRALLRLLDGTLAATLDTRGYIHYLLGDLDAAREDLDEAIELYYRYRDELTRLLLTCDSIERPYRRDDLRRAQSSLAEILYHRGLVLSKLGDTRRANQDFEQAAQLGFDVEAGH